ncbi:hypothetical protein AOQ84DRAFT_390101 [Glonium stellatum]|uniref:Uncharacterized protein n=1 Tax=Glonium stellatum TaxID=574774 RepID=A0A8E2EXA8_9PEZI|nr:hypothetical protein AOQ84DRAFT_390101 [Glonium stellatum]
MFLSITRGVIQKKTNPRDKVYALRGICTDADNAATIPDYSKAVQEAFIETARYLISEPDVLHVLGAARIGRTRSVEGLPSWVPDWSPKAHAPLNAGYNTTKSSQPIINVDTARDILSVVGVRIDELKATGQVYTTPAFIRSTCAGSARNFIKEYLWHEKARILATEDMMILIEMASRSLRRCGEHY